MALHYREVEIEILIGVIEAELVQDKFAEVGAEERVVHTDAGHGIEEVRGFKFFANQKENCCCRHARRWLRLWQRNG